MSGERSGNTILAYAAGGTVLAQVRPPGQDHFAAPVPLGPGRPSLGVAAASKVTLTWPGQRPDTTTLVDWTP